MTLDDRIAQIMKKVEKLSAKKRRFPCGKFPPEWKEPITEEQVMAYEKEKGIRLPEDYRRFITTVASAGTQPFYGLYGLLDKKPSYEFEPIVEKKFPYTLSTPLKIAEMSEEEYDKYWNDDENEEYMQGYILLCHEGCGMESILIVNTDAEEVYGTVWFCDLANDYGIMPIYHPQTREPMHFLEWLEYWVDQMLLLEEEEYFSYGELTFF
ncbi:MAG: SMI1/KNR4 family protein [Lachnospiraceae bacterium]|nr:SMI1/KNR4 family protein [Lachnospiraceae bacterium]